MSAQKEKKIKIAGIDSLVLFGVNDCNLELVERQYSVSISARGDEVTLKGLEANVDIATKVFNEMIYSTQRNSRLTKEDLEAIFDLVSDTSAQAKETHSHDELSIYTKDGTLKPRGETQKKYIQLVNQNDIVFAIGPAGTGKTYLGVALAVDAYRKRLINRIILARPAVEAGESLGFLPGDLKEKVDPYLRPLYDALDDMIPHDKLKTMMEKRVIEIVPLAYMRGRTLSNAFIILDEAQNATAMQMKMFLTRIGVGSMAIITGDPTQIDLPKNVESGLLKAEKILKNIEGIGFIYFDKSDVVRHRLVREIINAYEKDEVKK